MSDRTELFVALAHDENVVPRRRRDVQDHRDARAGPAQRDVPFTATNPRNNVGVEKGVDVVGIWRCPTVFVWAT